MRFICQICGYIYDEVKENRAFETLPDDWKCPLCGAMKTDFKPEGPARAETGGQPAAAKTDVNVKKLSAGQMSAVFSNLARGCEKQYKAEEAGWFRELADYCAAITAEIPDASAEQVAALLQKDIDSYGGVRATADAAGDRGAARICVWGEKVTRMLSSLVNRYLREGEAMLADTNVWVCSVCGFVYVGEEAPELCPVCKVPAWKFEKIEGRTKG